MNLLGWKIERTKAPVGITTTVPASSTSVGWSGLFGLGVIRESFAGAWQRNITVDNAAMVTQSTVWSCVTLIAGDISKIAPRLVELQNADARPIWVPTENPAYSPVLRKPNHYQNRINFYERWVLSKLLRGNTYVLKERDNRGVVTALYILDPTRVQVLVAPDGSVFYQLSADNLAGIQTDVTVPASEIIHDLWNPIYHDLCGISPLIAAALPAMQSLRMQQSSERFFANNAKPGGVLTAPNKISQESADRIRQHWESNFGGEDNSGKVAVLGDGLHYEPMAFTAVESDLAKQLGWTDEKICAVFHVPPFMVGVGPMPTYDNIEKLNLQYYSQCLQRLIECIEECLDQGLGLGLSLGIDFDTKNLIRMDSVTKMENAVKGVTGAVFTPNEARADFDLPPKVGGDSPMLQQQNYSIEALAKRDSQPDPFGTATPAASTPAAETADGEDVKALYIKAAELQAGSWYSECPQP